MRTLFGMILGCLLTIGGAYIHDSSLPTTPSPDATAERPMVNWDVVGANWQRFKAGVQEQWTKLSGHARD